MWLNFFSNLGYQLPYFVTMVVVLSLIASRRKQLGKAFLPAFTGFAISTAWSMGMFFWHCIPPEANTSFKALETRLAYDKILAIASIVCTIVSTILITMALLRREAGREK